MLWISAFLKAHISQWISIGEEGGKADFKDYYIIELFSSADH